MEEIRKISRISAAQPTLEGAGVHLKRAFGHGELPLFDPFLMLDDFRSDQAEEFQAGFPWHPHRGIETITYVLAGDVEHRDSLGNQGDIGAGDVQWMTAGSGIIHQEMPRGDAYGSLQGFQLWLNLPAERKMMAPRYQSIAADAIPVVEEAGGVVIKVICGVVGEVRGPVEDIVTEPEYLDITVPAGASYRRATKAGHTVLAYVIGGRGYFGGESDKPVGNGDLVLFGEGAAIEASAVKEPLRFLLLSGRPLAEPIAWAGPVVMNSQEELKQTFQELEKGDFTKGRAGQ